jgi:hypothetical protein
MYPAVIPAKADIQYAASSRFHRWRLGILDARRSPSSGARSRDPVAAMTAVGEHRQRCHCEERLRRPVRRSRLAKAEAIQLFAAQDCFARNRYIGFDILPHM